MEGWQGIRASPNGGGRVGFVRGGLDGIGGSGIGPLTLVAGAKKLFQDVSGDTLNGFPAFPRVANVLAERALPHDCTTTNGRPDGSSNGTH
jgi:hypothetical protein